MTKEELVRPMAKALAEVCLRAYVTDCWILHDRDPEDDDFCVTQPWYELPRLLPVSEEALTAIISGPAPRDWDADVAALAGYIAAAVLEGNKAALLACTCDCGIGDASMPELHFNDCAVNRGA